jgi:hypothetical protein
MSDTMADYLKIPAVSAGVLRTLIEECPYAAWFASPFNPEPPPPDDTDASDAGTIIHSILLEGSTDCCVVVDPADHPNEKGGGLATGFTNKSAKAERDAIRATGKIPILKQKWAPIVAAVQSVHRYVESTRETEPAVWRLFQPAGGESERTITFDPIGGVPCKIRPDRIASDFGLIVDVKTTLTSAEPDRWGRSQLFGAGYYLGAAFYQLGVKTYVDATPAYVFLVVSQEPPYLCSLVSLDPAGLDLAHRKIMWALEEWRRCMKAGHFPGYSPRVSYIETPAYLEAQWLEREMQEPFA